LDHVGDQRAGQPVQGAVLAAVGRAADQKLRVLLRDGDVAVDALGELTARAVDPHELGLDGDGHRLGDRDGLAADARHGGYQTSATTSPPTPAWRAWWPVMTPEDVERIEVPMPPWTFGISPALAYVRRPGRETRLRPEIAER